MSPKTRTFTDEEWLGRLWDVENVKQLMTKRCYYIYNDARRQELDDLWVKKPENRATASYGSNWGYYVGMDEIAKYYVLKHDREMKARLARYMWYDMTALNDGHPDGTAEELLLPWLVACDLIKEDGAWKIWHLFMSNDMFITIGKPVSQIPVYPGPGEDPVRAEFGEPTIPMLAHDNTFGWADMYPPMPEAYDTFDNQNSYGPDGHPKNRKLVEVFL